MHRTQGHHEFQRAGQRHRHGALRPGSLRDEVCGEPIRPVVELGVGQRGVLVDDRHGVRALGGLILDHACQVGGGQRHVGASAAGQRVGPLGRGEHIGPGDGPAGPVGQLGQGGDQPAHDALRLLGADGVGAVLEPQLQPVAAQRRHQTQRVVHGVLGVFHRDPQPVQGCLDAAPVHRIVLEHHSGVEQFGHAREGLQLGQAQVLVIGERGLFTLDAGGEVAERFGRVEPDAHRHGVDQQAHHRLDPGQHRGPAGGHSAEHHVVLPGQPGQQQGPAGLHRCIDRDAQRLRGVLQGRGEALRQRDLDMLVTGRLRGTLRSGAGRGDQRPLCQACEGLAPHAPGLLAVPLGQPRKVVPVGRGRWELRAVSVGGVEGEQLAQQQRTGPAVEQDVMVGHHETVGVRCETHQDETDQRWLGQVEAGVPVRPQQPVQFGVPVGLRQP